MKYSKIFSQNTCTQSQMCLNAWDMGESTRGFACRWTRSEYEACSIAAGEGWGENFHRGCRELNFTGTGSIIKQAALKTEEQGLLVCRIFSRATLRMLGSARIGANFGFCACFRQWVEPLWGIRYPMGVATDGGGASAKTGTWPLLHFLSRRLVTWSYPIILCFVFFVCFAFLLLLLLLLIHIHTWSLMSMPNWRSNTVTLFLGERWWHDSRC